MCGILAVLGKRDPEEVHELAARMSHRGPDERGKYVSPAGHVMCHERLSIIDLSTGKQPIQGTDSVWVMHNGEIYNHMELRENELKAHTFRTTCDSEVIAHLYEEYGNDFCNLLKGVFVFVVTDGEKFIAGRDPIGVKPLYYGHDKDGNMFISSEMKSLSDQCDDFKPFPPGHYYTPETGFVKYFNPEWQDHTKNNKKANLKELNEALTESTRKRLMSDVPLGVLLSGGLDSSLISSITKRLVPDQELHSFSVGLGPDAPDLVAAREVADFIGTKHHEVYFSVEQGIKDLEKIIWHLETYDVTTIRASTPMYYLSKAITEKGIKVVLSGEGADEIFGGYLYFRNAPSVDEFSKECVWRVNRLSTADCLRADKSTMAHGLEARVPFLDRDFLDVAMAIRGEDKVHDHANGIMEKYILRAAFDDKENPYLPEKILWRQKEQFSDGVGYSWIDGIVEYCNSQVTDEELASAKERWPHNTPETKEAYYFRSIFDKLYPGKAAQETVLRWIPKWQNSSDPSGRACDVHVEHTDKFQDAK